MLKQTMSTDDNALSSINTLAELFAWRVRQTPTAEAYREFDNSSGQWISSSWQETNQHIAGFINALSTLAMARGSRIAILLPNGLHAVCIDQATLALAHVPVPMHALDNPASIAYILSDSDASFLIAATDEQWQSIAATNIAFPSLQQVVVLQKTQPESNSSVPVLNLQEWLATAHNTQEQSTAQFPEPHDLAALVYTSGTTGKPKGVMLTHQNVMSNVRAVVQRIAPVTDDVFLSFLPLSHTFERTAGYYLPIAAGACVVFSRSVKQLPEELLLVRPTILISVPRIYERVYAVIQSKLASSKAQNWLFNVAIAVGWRRFAGTQGMSSVNVLRSTLDELSWQILNPLVASKLMNQFGGRLRVAVSGGAALSPAISHCFLALGIPIVQGYGMTETAPIIAFNAPDDNDPATVGRPITGVEVKIGDNAELLVRGPNVMRGYWKREEDTAKTIIDGWLHTGDQAEIVADRVRIKGRVKEIIVTSTGEKIAPVDLELAITNDSAFEQAYAFGDNAPFIACAVVLSLSYWQQLAISLSLNPDDKQSLQSDSAVNAVVKRLRDLTQSFPYYAQPKAAILTLEPWTIENTLITPTLKLKRKNLEGHFAQDIQRIYSR
ncbi:AMP-dependent synthetase/ligase [Solimicrobium silvestre]|uniref:Long-chain acyl-CoA synthetases (AMP-forming) n=1 Tax=Solimicrobium silvestre TaxID=2099400 RepID=A0A2S9GV29_9BURK|nr:long-chain fatty acid--CoA ligase [Solimicrobium silvestre]PRC91561.1 Long-chain acyl-CoA synthetases (AMP-forming) [Solimicrobium silvestre]